MWKWIFVALVALVALGLWMILDPRAGAAAGNISAAAEAALARAGVNIGPDSLFAPISREFNSLSNSVSTMFSSVTIHIDMPSVQIPH